MQHTEVSALYHSLWGPAWGHDCKLYFRRVYGSFWAPSSPAMQRLPAGWISYQIRLLLPTFQPDRLSQKFIPWLARNFFLILSLNIFEIQMSF